MRSGTHWFETKVEDCFPRHLTVEVLLNGFSRHRPNRFGNGVPANLKVELHTHTPSS